VDVSAWPELGRLMAGAGSPAPDPGSARSQKAGGTRSTIVNWELGYRVPRVQQLRLLASTLVSRVAQLERTLPATARPLFWRSAT